MVSCPVQGRAHILFPCERGETALVRLRFCLLYTSCVQQAAGGHEAALGDVALRDDFLCGVGHGTVGIGVEVAHHAVHLQPLVDAVSYTHLDVYKRPAYIGIATLVMPALKVAGTQKCSFHKRQAVDCRLPPIMKRNYRVIPRILLSCASIHGA